MGEEEMRWNLHSFNLTIPFGIFDQETKTFYNQDEQQGRQRASLPDTMRGRKKGSRRTIYEDNKVGRRDTAQNPIHPSKRDPYLNENKTDKSPINPVKGFWQIQLKDEGTSLVGFDSM